MESYCLHRTAVHVYIYLFCVLIEYSFTLTKMRCKNGLAANADPAIKNVIILDINSLQFFKFISLHDNLYCNFERI